MTEALLIYMYLAIGSIITQAVVAGLFVTILFPAAFIMSGIESDWGATGEKPGSYGCGAYRAFFWLKSVSKRASLTIVAIWLLAAIYPSKSDVAYIVGGAALISVATTEEAKKLPDNVLRAANRLLEEVDIAEESDK